ncbi:hypothetical protein MAM1_0088c04794 [Mucor ambiguus]|uniref:Uncharacterized protein n=1 Tax=Mucor ambiguus TaxID=91626 RepID=A0A0C9MDE3_9FUNG|nr:hypothetical protein MAM1_0088c04794 [Mucor ambiguus]
MRCFPTLIIAATLAKSVVSAPVHLCCCSTCHFDGTVTAKEADAVIATVNTFVPQATATLSSIFTKKPEFDAILLATALVKSEIKSLDTQTKVLDACLIDKTSPSYVAAVNALVTQISSSFASTMIAYSI